MLSTQAEVPQRVSDDRFRRAFACFRINHVGDPAAGLTELRRVVHPGGRIAVTIWPHPQAPLQRLWSHAFEAAGAERPPLLPTLEPDKDFARTPEGLCRLLRNAGLKDVRCDAISWVHRADPEDWWSGPANGIGTLGVLMQHQPADMVARIRYEYARLTAVYRQDDGTLALPTGALLASGSV